MLVRNKNSAAQKEKKKVECNINWRMNIKLFLYSDQVQNKEEILLSQFQSDEIFNLQESPKMESV